MVSRKVFLIIRSPAYWSSLALLVKMSWMQHCGGIIDVSIRMSSVLKESEHKPRKRAKVEKLQKF